MQLQYSDFMIITNGGGIADMRDILTPSFAASVMPFLVADHNPRSGFFSDQDRNSHVEDDVDLARLLILI